ALKYDCEGDVAAGPAVPADQFHEDGAEDGDEGRHPHRRPGQQEAEADTGHGHVADAVAHQGLAALDEVDADRGGGDADEDGGEQGPLHEGVVEDVHRIQLSSPVRIGSVPAGACGWTWSWP